MQTERVTNYRSWLNFEQKKPDVPEGKIFDPWRLRPKTLEEFHALSEEPGQLSEEQLVYLAWFGLLGPTAHNTVPQRFRFSPEDNALDLWADRQYVLKHSDKVGRQTAVGIGCVVGNIEQAARCYGLEPDVEIFSAEAARVKPHVLSEDRYTRVLRVNFQQGDVEPEGHQWLTAMLERKVVRAEYDRTVKLEAGLIEQMQTHTQERYPSIQLHLITSSMVLNPLGKFQEQADKFVVEDPGFAYELGSWLIPNEDEKNPLAMRGREFGLDDDFARKIHLGLTRQGERLLPDEIASFAKGGKAGIKSSSAVGILTVTEDTPREQIEAGRAYEDLALLLHLNNFWTSIHAGITEVDWVNSVFAASALQTTRRPTAVFRIGRVKRLVDAQRPHSSRPPIEEVFLPDEVGKV